MFDKFENRYIISGELMATTAIHIGAAEDVFKPGGNRNPFFRNAEDQPMIPGSSLKGLMRSFLEQMLRSEGGKKAFPQGTYCTEAEPCVKKEEYKEIPKSKGKDPDAEWSKYLYGTTGENGKLCTICRIFGSGNNGAKLSIRDAKVDPNTFNREFEIRSGVSIDRDLGKSIDGNLYEVEVVPEGTKFSFHAILENASQNEWKCVYKLLQAMNLGMLTVGGMKSRGLGGMQLQNITYLHIDQDNLFEYLDGGKMEPIKFGQEKEVDDHVSGIEK